MVSASFWGKLRPSLIQLCEGQYLAQRRHQLSPREVVWQVVLSIPDGESIELVQEWEKELLI
jgi:hypothetical protein